MTEKSSSKTIYATSYFFDWEKFRASGIAELYIDTYYSSSQTEPERSKEPIAKGITAFFCAYNYSDIEPVISLIDRLNIEYNIEKYYEYYEKVLLTCARKENNKRSPIRRSQDKDLIHVVLEKELEYQDEGILFTEKLCSENGNGYKLLVEYVQDFPMWLKQKHQIHIDGERDSNPVCISSKTETDKSKIVEKYLLALSGKDWSGQQIMHPNDYKNLVEWTKALVITREVPQECTPIYLKHHIKKEFIRKTYHQIYDKVYGTHRQNDCFIDFLRTVLPDEFSSNLERVTLKSTFSSYNGGITTFERDRNDLLEINNLAPYE